MELAHKFQGLYNRLQKQLKILKKQAQKQNITCFRWYDKDMPEHPLIIDVYEDNVVVYEYESKHNLEEEAYLTWQETCLAIIQNVAQVPLENIYFKSRRRKKNRQEQYEKLDSKKIYHVVNEGGLKFYTNYNDFLDTGVFLDHRPTRNKVRQMAENKNVLNLFCYTGSFSIYAANGGANNVWSVDLSNTYIDWCIQNQELNEQACSSTQFKWIKADVLQYINELPDNFFDIVILDPPTFSNSKSMKAFWDVQLQHASLINSLAHCMRKEGIIIFSTNAIKFELAERLNLKWQIKDITKATTDFDFVNKLKRYCFTLTKL